MHSRHLAHLRRPAHSESGLYNSISMPCMFAPANPSFPAGRCPHIIKDDSSNPTVASYNGLCLEGLPEFSTNSGQHYIQYSGGVWQYIAVHRLALHPGHPPAVHPAVASTIPSTTSRATTSSTWPPGSPCRSPLRSTAAPAPHTTAAATAGSARPPTSRSADRRWWPRRRGQRP